MAEEIPAFFSSPVNEIHSLSHEHKREENGPSEDSEFNV